MKKLLFLLFATLAFTVTHAQYPTDGSFARSGSGDSLKTYINSIYPSTGRSLVYDGQKIRRINRGVAQTLSRLDSTSINRKVLRGTRTVDFASQGTLTSADSTTTITGAALGDFVIVSSSAAPAAGVIYTGHVSATDTVAVRFNNYTSGSVNPSSITFKILVIPQ